MPSGGRSGMAGGRRTKIVCTLGPSSSSEAVIARLASAGMNVVRLNFSYGNHDDHARLIAKVRAVSLRLGSPIGILQDLSGPKLRVGVLLDARLTLRRRDEVVLTAGEPRSHQEIPLPVPEVFEALAAGQRVLLSDGLIELKVLEAKRREARCEVVVGGELKSHQGVHLPEVSVPVRTVTRKDLADLKFGLEQGVDWVAMSFVRSAEDLLPLRRAMKRAHSTAGLIAKIEKHEATEDLDGIIEASDGVMVARGDLGIEVAMDRVPILQKQIIAACRYAGKPVITATQMLESMMDSPRPTRAELTDVANAVFDGTDAVMLSGETAIGRYPVEAVKVMAKIIARAETAFDFDSCLDEALSWPCETVTSAIAQATCALADDLEARAIVTATSTGHTATMVAMHRPRTPIIAVTPKVATQNRLALVWGVHPVVAPRGRHTDALIVKATAMARGVARLRAGDIVVVTAGVPVGVPGRTNLIKVETVTDGDARRARE